MLDNVRPMVFQKGNKLGEGRKEGSKNKKTLALLERWETHLDKVFEEIEIRKLSGENYNDLIRAAEIAQKQIQLLSGGPTERSEIVGVEITVRK